MARLTITLSESRHRALKTAAARRGVTIGELIDASLEAFGVKSREDVLAIVARAQAASGMAEADALALAVEETRASRTR